MLTQATPVQHKQYLYIISKNLPIKLRVTFVIKVIQV